MKYYGNTADQPVLEGGVCALLSAIHPARHGQQEDQAMEYSTIDGEMINSTAGSDAVKKGNGLFIGDYFVGILDSFSGIGSTPYLRY